MLSRKYRLTKNKDFARVAQQGGVYRGRYFNLKWIENNLTNSRFGLIVSLKVDKKAVVRNKIKRRLRAIVKEYLDQIVPGYDFLILTKNNIKTLSFIEIKEELFQVFKKNRLIK
jgi:ribonuclease P protein component